MMMFIILTLIFLFLLYKFSTLNKDFWLKKGVPYKKPYPIFGNLLQVVLKRETLQSNLIKMYKEGEGHRYFGIFNMAKPFLLLRDTKLIASVLKTDFSRFSARGLVVDHERDPLSVNVFFMDGCLWKRSRELLRPGFKSGRLRAIVPMIEETAKMLFKERKEPFNLEMKMFAKRFSAAVTAGPVLGLEFNEEVVDVFVQHCNEAFNLHGWRAIPVFMRIFLPRIAIALGMKGVPRATEDFFLDVVEKVKAGRLPREGYIQTIMSSINGLAAHYPNKEFLDAALSGQFFIFVLGGFETTSSAVTHAIHLLAQHQDICDRARQEILDVLVDKKGNFTYDNLKDMKYLENIINEVLRLHPPLAGITRVCTATYTVPETDIVLQPGDCLQIPIICVQNDPKYFTKPEEFRPSRFDEPIIEGSFLPFADGPRNCLGMRLAMMELKILLAYILINFNVSLDPRTPKKLDFDPEHLISMPTSDIWIRFTPV